jgi:hypothetical protein
MLFVFVPRITRFIAQRNNRTSGHERKKEKVLPGIQLQEYNVVPASAANDPIIKFTMLFALGVGLIVDTILSAALRVIETDSGQNQLCGDDVPEKPPIAKTEPRC